MRILTWNIQATKGCDDQYNLPRIIDTINDFGEIDIICLQEVARNIPTMMADDQVSNIGIQFPEFEMAWAPGFSTLGPNRKRCEFGNLTLVRHSIFRNARTHILPSPFIDELQMPRTVSEVVVRQGEFDFAVFNTHLAFHSAHERIGQIYALTQLRNQYIEKSDLQTHDDATGPYSYFDHVQAVILCGDLNVSSDSDEFKNHISGNDWMDCWENQQNTNNVRGSKRPPTCGCFDPLQWPQGPHVRDYFLATKNIATKIVSVTVNVETDASDHQPVLMEIAL